jgi:hypothetical protein
MKPKIWQMGECQIDMYIIWVKALTYICFEKRLAKKGCKGYWPQLLY